MQSDATRERALCRPQPRPRRGRRPTPDPSRTATRRRQSRRHRSRLRRRPEPPHRHPCSPDPHRDADGHRHPQLLTIIKTGSGTVMSVEPGIACGATCSAGTRPISRHAAGAHEQRQQRLLPRLVGRRVRGPFHDCTVTMDAAKSVTATFATQTFNLVSCRRRRSRPRSAAPRPTTANATPLPARPASTTRPPTPISPGSPTAPRTPPPGWA